MEELPAVITDSSYRGRWLIFVPSRQKGKELCNLLAGLDGTKKIRYVDADYGKKKHDEAMDEVTEIIQNGVLSVDILICTSVLDNGISLHDKKLRNLVILADDEVEFVQMVGRKRLTSESEQIHLFLKNASSSYFKKRKRECLNLYWRLCDNARFPAENLLSLIEDGVFTIDEVTSYYTQEHNTLYLNPLSIIEIGSRFTFCSRMEQKLNEEENAFIKEQLRWLGIEFPDEVLLTGKVGYSQEDVDQITSNLKKIFEEENGLISMERFDELRKKVLAVIGSVNNNFRKKDGTPSTINKALQIVSEWKDYCFCPYNLTNTTLYELEYKGEKRIQIKSDEVTPDYLKNIFSTPYEDISQELFFDITGTRMPNCLFGNTPEIKMYLNLKMKETEHLKNYMIKNQSGGKLKLVRRSRKEDA